MDDSYFTTSIARHVWEAKYQYRDNAVLHYATIADIWSRVARALAQKERHSGYWQGCFYDVLENFRFMRGGRIQAGAGTAHNVTLFNCFVMGTIADSMDGIFDALKEGAVTMQQGGGVGYDFSTLRPRGTRAYSVGSTASGACFIHAHLGQHVCHHSLNGCPSGRHDGNVAFRYRGIHNGQTGQNRAAAFQYLGPYNR